METLGEVASSRLPIDELLPKLSASLDRHNTVLLTAPPGAGKTTRVPMALLDAPWLGDRSIVMLEPRRLAARSAARFMAQQLGEPVGQRIGYRTRLETRVSKHTRIEVVTEGILVRMLQNDPAMGRVACVIFDEFHERSLQSDLGLTLVRETQQALRPDLRLIVMSATLMIDPLQDLLDRPPLLRAQGRSFPVAVEYRPPPRDRKLAQHVAATIRLALEQHAGSVLVFLPGMREIRWVAEALSGSLPSETHLYLLHGSLPPAEQDAAIAPATNGRRKVVLATAIAETSLTIEGIRIVIDAGLARAARFDPNSGMSRLVTETVSRASAEQRAGRAGRLEPGICYRLWSESQQKRLQAAATPEIMQADLAPVVLELAQWGVTEPDDLDWLNPPPKPHWDQARTVLAALQALDPNGRITRHGMNLLKPGLHPRLAHLLIEGKARGLAKLAAELAALLSDRDPLPSDAGIDLFLRVKALRKGGPRLKTARRLAQKLSGNNAAEGRDESSRIGELLALAYPDRIAKARGGRGRFLLSNGRGAFVSEEDALAGADWLVAAALDGQAREARIHLGAEISSEALESVLGAQISDETLTGWDESLGAVVAKRVRKLGALTLDEEILDEPEAQILQNGLLDAVRQRGLDRLPWSSRLRQWQARVEFLKALDPATWPAVDDATLGEHLDDWLAPFLAGARRWSDVESIDLRAALENRLDFEQQKQLSVLAPEQLKIPTGRWVKLDYTVEGGPVLATKLQSIFGWTKTPSLANGRAPVTLHLLSPAGRPVAITRDLASFWQQGYPDVRKDLRGRYPKHPWPENPLAAKPSDQVKRRSAAR